MSGISIVVLLDPVPGSCNLEFPLANDPNIYLENEEDQTLIKFAYGSANKQSFFSPCGSSVVHHMLEYVIYQLFVDERHRDELNFMATLQQMIDPSRIEQKANEVSSSFPRCFVSETKISAFMLNSQLWHLL
jgi:hypothetical protein